MTGSLECWKRDEEFSGMEKKTGAADDGCYVGEEKKLDFFKFF